MYDFQYNAVKDAINKYGVKIASISQVDDIPTTYIKGLMKHKQQMIITSEYLQQYKDEIIFITLEPCKNFIKRNDHIYNIVGDISNVEGIYKYNCSFNQTITYNITLQENSADIKQGKTYQIIPVCTKNNMNIDNPKVDYKSLNTDIATVDDKGLITGVAEGNAIIECSFADITVQFNANIQGVIYTMNVEEISDLNVNGTCQIVVNCFADGVKIDNPTGVVYTSSNTDVATIDNTGLITAKAEGSVNISVNWNGLNYTQEIKVNSVPTLEYKWINSKHAEDNAYYQRIPEFSDATFTCKKLINGVDTGEKYTYFFNSWDKIGKSSYKIKSNTTEGICVYNDNNLSAMATLFALDSNGIAVSKFNIILCKSSTTTLKTDTYTINFTIDNPITDTNTHTITYTYTKNGSPYTRGSSDIVNIVNSDDTVLIVATGDVRALKTGTSKVTMYFKDSQCIEDINTTLPEPKEYIWTGGDNTEYSASYFNSDGEFKYPLANTRYFRYVNTKDTEQLFDYKVENTTIPNNATTGYTFTVGSNPYNNYNTAKIVVKGSDNVGKSLDVVAYTKGTTNEVARITLRVQ